MIATPRWQSLVARTLACTPPGRLETAVPGLSLMRADGPTEPLTALYEACFCVVLQGAKRTVVGDQVFRYTGGDYLLVSLDLPVSGAVTEASPERPYLSMALRLERSCLAGLLAQLPPPDAAHAASPMGLGVQQLDEVLLDTIERLLGLVERPADVPVLYPLLERELLYRLLQGPLGPQLRQIGLPDSPATRVSRVTEWLTQHYAEPFDASALAAMASMSVPSLHRHFRALTAMSPLQYQKRLRLQAARARLLARDGNVATVAFEVGYASPAQFTREYQRLFGAPPLRDSNRLRAAQTPALLPA